MIARMDIQPSIVDEVWSGLSGTPKSLPSKLFYDTAGSRLFDQITHLPEYYLTRSELEILKDRAVEIARAASARGSFTVIELGAGSAAKTSTLLAAMAAQPTGVRYIPVDISPAALAKAKQRLQRWNGRIRVRPLVADFSEGFGFLHRAAGRKLVLYLGSSIGNFNQDEAIGMLAQVRAELSDGDALLLGTDLVKDPAILVPAYDDAQGVTASFNKNILRRLNREFAANFDLDAFRHLACWNAPHARMEMHLVSQQAQTARIGLLDREIAFTAGERIHTENSYKYTLPAVRDLLDAADFHLEHTWFDHRQWYALHWTQV